MSSAGVSSVPPICSDTSCIKSVKSKSSINPLRSYTNMSTQAPAKHYQNQKIIQRTVRVPSSLYTMNLGALSAYQAPHSRLQTVSRGGVVYSVPSGVLWNQASDRASPSVQTGVSSSGSGYGGDSTRRTRTGQRPGAATPGGTGVDVKHGSYERYLLRIKARAPLRRGQAPAVYGEGNVQGGKVMKTSIVSGCNCSAQAGDGSIFDRVSNDIQHASMGVV